MTGLNLSTEMYEKYSAIVDRLKESKCINAIQHSIASDLVFDLTENHSNISEDNNPIVEYFENVDEFVDRLAKAYEEIKKDNPDLESWSEGKIAGCAMSWAIQYVE